MAAREYITISTAEGFLNILILILYLIVFNRRNHTILAWGSIKAKNKGILDEDEYLPISGLAGDKITNYKENWRSTMHI